MARRVAAEIGVRSTEIGVRSTGIAAVSSHEKQVARLCAHA